MAQGVIFEKLSDGAVRINDHQNEKADAENQRTRDGDTVKILLDDAGASLVGIHGAGDHFINARALARVEHDEHNKSDAGSNQQDKHENKQKIQFDLLLSMVNVLAIRKFKIISVIAADRNKI